MVEQTFSSSGGKEAKREQEGVGEVLVCFALMEYPNKSNLEGFTLPYSLAGTQSSWEKYGSRSMKPACNIGPKIQRQRENRKLNQAIKPQSLSLVMYILLKGPIS